MSKLAAIEDLQEKSGPGRLQIISAMAVVGVVFTVAVLVMLGNFTRPESAIDQNITAVGSPFADTDLVTDKVTPLDEETCQVMSTTIKDINARMSEGVTVQQARYFRARRNKLYQMMRERCGV